MTNLWLLVKRVLKSLYIKYDVVNINDVISSREDLRPGKNVYISHKHSTIGHQVEIVLVSDDQHFLIEEKMKMEKKINKIHKCISKCVSHLEGLTIVKDQNGSNRTRVLSSNEHDSSLSDIDSNPKAANDHNLVNSTVKYNKRCRSSELNSTVNNQLSRSQNSTYIKNKDKASPIPGPSRIKRTSSDEYDLSSAEIDSMELADDNNLVESAVKHNKRFKRSEPEPRINEKLRRARNSTPRSNTISRKFKLNFDQVAQTDPISYMSPEMFLKFKNEINSYNRKFLDIINIVLEKSSTNSTTKNQNFTDDVLKIKHQFVDLQNTSSVKRNVVKQADRLKKRGVFTQNIDNSLPSTSGVLSAKTANNSLPLTLNDPSAETTNKGSPTKSNEPSAQTTPNTLPSTSNEQSAQTTSNTLPSTSNEPSAQTTSNILPSTSNEPSALTTNNSLTSTDKEEMVTCLGYSLPLQELKNIDWNSSLTAFAEFAHITKKKGKAVAKQSTNETKMRNTRQRSKNFENQDSDPPKKSDTMHEIRDVK